MSRIFLCLTVVSILLIGVSAQAKFENFSSDPVGWTSNTTDLGWVGDPYYVAGGVIRSGPNETTRKYYADTNLGGTFDLSQDIKFTTDFQPVANGGDRWDWSDGFLGFFDSTATGVISGKEIFSGPAFGIMIADGTQSSERLRGYIGNAAGSEFRTDAAAAQIMVQHGYTYTIDMSWQASTRTFFWSVTSDEVEVKDKDGVTAVPQSWTLTQAQVDSLGGSFNAFGIANRTNEVGTGEAWKEAYIDNATYAVGAYDPLPANGDQYVLTTQNTLSWTNLEGVLKCDLYFGTEPNVLMMTKVTVTNPAGRETVDIPPTYLPLDNLTDYYWVVDSYIGVVDPNDPNTIILPDNPNLNGIVWTFRVNENQAPVVDNVPDIQYLWLGKDGDPNSATLVFTPNVTDDGLPAGNPLTYQWTQLAGPAVVVSDPNDLLNKDISVVLTELSNDYQFQLTVSDGDLTTTVQPSVVLATDACAASAQQPGFSYTLGDINQDCYVNLEDFYAIALTWLECTDTLTGCP